MSRYPTVIIVTGLPATGKTTLSRKLAEAFNIPFINRDDIKVLIMDELGWGDRAWSKKVGRASYSLLDYILTQFSRTNSSFVVESNFSMEFGDKKFNQIHRKGYTIVQIICSADDDVIINRWKERAARDATHPSNTEGMQGLNELLETIGKGQAQPLNIPSTIIRFDTTKATPRDAQDLIERLQTFF